MIIRMKKAGLLLLPLITISLEILPFGAVCVFAASPNETIRKTFSYFSLIPFGYANFAPFITSLLTCVILLLALISIRKNNLLKTVFIVSLITAAVSILPLLLGIRYFSVVGLLITISLVIECGLAKLSTKS